MFLVALLVTFLTLYGVNGDTSFNEEEQCVLDALDTTGALYQSDPACATNALQLYRDTIRFDVFPNGTRIYDVTQDVIDETCSDSCWNQFNEVLQQCRVGESVSISH